MKKITLKYAKLLSLFILVSATLTSCNKDKESEGKYSIIYYPSIELEGESIVAIPLGESYVEPGYASISNGAEIETTVTSDLDEEAPGYYTITYSATNEDGYSASASRNVVIYDPAVADVDYSGSYARVGYSNSTSVWTKANDYTYNCTNPGGVDFVSNPLFNVPFTVYTVEPGIVIVPQQQSGQLAPFMAVAPDGSGSVLIPFDYEAAVGDIAYSWICIGPNFGTAVRPFRKL